MKYIFTFTFAIYFSIGVNAQTRSYFNSFEMPLDTFWNGSDLSGNFIDGNIEYPNSFDTIYNYWSGGWALSTMRDDSTAGFSNSYSAITAEAKEGPVYSIGQSYSYFQVDRDEKVTFNGIYITNTTYAYLSMKNGDNFAKKFGGDDGTDPDYFKLRIYGVQNTLVDTSNFVDFYLADFRFDDSTDDYIVNEWQIIDLSSLGYIEGLSFELSSSDSGQWGMNTPGFFAMDKVKYSYKPYNSQEEYIASLEIKDLPLDTFWNGGDLSRKFLDFVVNFDCVYDTLFNYWSGGFALSTMRDEYTPGFSNLYSSIAGCAYDGHTYAVGQNNSSLWLSMLTRSQSAIYNIKVTNTAYAYLSMKNGDNFAKKFGGDDGTDPDFFKLRIYASNGAKRDMNNFFDFYLADFRFDDDSLDYIIDDWTEINIFEELGYVGGLTFELISSDNGAYGMNTPGFFAIDRIEYDVESGVDDVAVKNSFDVYPNPANEFILLKSNEIIENINYEIFNLSGQLLIKGNYFSGNSINISNLPMGTYFINIDSGDKATTKKFVKLCVK